MTASEEKITQVQDRIPQRDFIGSTHNYQPRHVIHQVPGHISRSLERETFETNDFNDAFNISHNRSSNYLDESSRFDRGLDLEPRVTHVNVDPQTHNSKRRRFEELAPSSSERYREHNGRSRLDRTILVPLGRDDGWVNSHEQPGPVSPLSTVNPFIHRNPNVYVRPIEAVRHVDREMISCAVPYEASSPSHGPMRALGSVEALHPSSHSKRNLPTGSRQGEYDSLFSRFDAPGKGSLVPSFRDEQVRLQSSHVPFTSSKSSSDAYDHPRCEFPNTRLIDPLEHRAAGRQQCEQQLHSDFARLDTGSRYISGNSEPSIDGLETYRGTLVATIGDRPPTPLRGEARTCIFLRKLPDENSTKRNNAKLSSITPRLIHKVNSSPRGDSDKFLSFGAGGRVSQTWDPVREKVQENSWQPNSRLANDERYVICCILSKIQIRVIVS